jgi:hypothetical protein
MKHVLLLCVMALPLVPVADIPPPPCFPCTDGPQIRADIPPPPCFPCMPDVDSAT